MRALLILLEKEFRQIFRNPAILRMMFMMPAVQLLIMPLAADYEIKNVKGVRGSIMIDSLTLSKYPNK
ncbi:MAG: hypothetical protein U5K54_11620 [Cytophagales bacterium]|nr:hypothetical protein [Cytophagales bacterium]